MKKTMIAMGLALASVGAVSAQSAPEGDKWVAGFVEYYDTDIEKEGFPTFFDNGMGLGAEVGFRFKPQWAARLEWSHLDIDASSPGQDETGDRIGVDALYFLPNDMMYVFGGLKHLNLGESSRLANVGLGKHWNINEDFRVITEVAATHDFGEGYNDVSFKLGLAYSFGSKAIKSAPVVAAPVVAAVVAPLDADNDGVVDGKDKCAGTPGTDKVDADGCSVFNEAEVAVNLEVLFANNSSLVNNPNDQQFQEFADFMKRYPQTDTVIEGHASAPGKADYNQWISTKRAEAVRELLIENYGIDGDRLTAKGFGESQLLDTSNTIAANKVNRRITAKVTATKREKILKN